MADKLAAFLADGIGHDDDRTVALDRSDQRKTNALVAAGRLDNDGIRADFAVPLRVFNHLICRARLDRAADIESLKFYQHLSPLRIRQMLQANHGGMPYRFEYRMINHGQPFSHSIICCDSCSIIV